VYRDLKSDFSFRFQLPISASSFANILRAQANESDLDFSALSIFEYRGKDHRTVVEMPEKDRGLIAVATRGKAWAQKNSKRASKNRSDADKPLWYIWEAELVDTDDFNAAAAEEKAKDPEEGIKEQQKKAGKGSKDKTSSSSGSSSSSSGSSSSSKSK
jgi:hypothetical protein